MDIILQNKIKELIYRITEDIINLYSIQIPIHDMKTVVEKMGGTMMEYRLFVDSFEKVKVTGNTSFEIDTFPRSTIEDENFAIAQKLGYLFLYTSFIWETHFPPTIEKDIDGLNTFAASLLLRMYLKKY